MFGGGVECGLLHGRMLGEEKMTALRRFASGETAVLISTTVVEARPGPLTRHVPIHS